MKRHFTVSTFISTDGHTLLHWHRKLGMWLPPGGHIEADEDPREAALREAQEEANFPVVLLPTTEPLAYASPEQLPSPVTIMIENIPATPIEAAHQHIDLVYFARPVAAGLPLAPDNAWLWVSQAELETTGFVPALPEIATATIPEDVRMLGLAAIAWSIQAETGR